MATTETAGYLERYDAADDGNKVVMAGGWIRTEPAAFFEELREQRPILATPFFTLITRHADVLDALAHDDAFTVAPYATHMDTVVGPFMLTRDGSAQNWREKGIMQAILKPEDLPSIRATAARIADAALDEAAPAGRIDVVPHLGRHLALDIVDEHFGFPGPNRESMLRWSLHIQIDMFKNIINDAKLHEAAVTAGDEMRAYLVTLLAEKRAELAAGGTADDVVSRLVRTAAPPELEFGEDRMVSNVMGLLIGAVETTSQAVAQAVEQLLMRPDIKPLAIEAALADDPAGFDPYVWEALRLNPINPVVPRIAARDYTVAPGTAREAVIPAGTLVFAATLSAQHDADVTTDPEAFIVDRPAQVRIPFGFGQHTCLGRHVSSVVVPEVVRRVLRRPGVALIDGPEGKIDWKGTPFPESFWISFGEAGR